MELMNRKIIAEFLPASLLAACLTLICLVFGCARTEAPSPNIIAKASGDQPAAVPTSGFLGDHSQLQPGKEGQTALVYINPNAQWSKYTKIILDPVQFWASPDTKVSPDDQKTLCEYFYNKVKEDLEKSGYTIVSQPGPDVMGIQIALTDATSATPGLRSASVVVPQARVLNLVQSMGRGATPLSAPRRRRRKSPTPSLENGLRPPLTSGKAEWH